MKFSVTIPAYKAKFLKECIESVLAQTYKDFELIIVNDASPEDLTSIVQSFDDPRIRYYINETNCGALNVVDNWNKCLSYATGEYIICMGDDDKLKPNCLQIYNALIEKYPDLDVYHGWTEIINEKSETIDIQSPRPEYEGVYSLIWNRWTCRKRQFIGDFLFRTNALKANGGYYKLPLAWSSDDISAVIMAKKGIANTQDLCFEYRVNSQTISSTGNVEIKVESIVKERRWYKKFIENDFTLSEVEAIYLNLIKKWIDKHFDKKIGLYIGLGMIKNPIIIFSIWKKRKYYKLNNFVFKYAL
ncbi:glycosyltransferase family 2 protein, partial [Bacteroides gallinaceum]|uniref:glycosyltransferase family 2 protein n=1 Tax=Bacteroides gallinaceum TaxID=1462571 RepID=UPI0025A48C00